MLYANYKPNGKANLEVLGASKDGALDIGFQWEDLPEEQEVPEPQVNLISSIVSMAIHSEGKK